MVCEDCFDVIVFGKDGEDAVLDVYKDTGADELINHIHSSYDKMKTIKLDRKDHILKFLSVNSVDTYLEFSTKPGECCNRNLAGKRFSLEFYE